MEATHTIKRTCLACGQEGAIRVSRREAAFGLVDIHQILGKQCPNCGANTFSTVQTLVNLDETLLKEWATNEDLHLTPQDEELLLADELYLNLILLALDHFSVVDQKRNILLEALCIIVYDNSLKDNSHKDEALKQRVIKALNERKAQLKLADDWIMDYIKEVVYPQLTLG